MYIKSKLPTPGKVSRGKKQIQKLTRPQNETSIDLKCNLNWLRPNSYRVWHDEYESKINEPKKMLAAKSVIIWHPEQPKWDVIRVKNQWDLYESYLRGTNAMV